LRGKAQHLHQFIAATRPVEMLSSVRAICAAFIILADTAASHASLRHSGASFISSLEFHHVLRVCNAYPYKYPLDVYIGKEQLTTSPLSYKTCGEFHPTLKAGDKIDFKVSDSNAGSFSVSELPGNDAVLVLVIYRHDTVSTGISFESHVFANLLNAQVAVVDTYRGTAVGTPRIQDVKEHKDQSSLQRSEELRYNSVVAVNPGLYQVLLEGEDGKTKAQQDLVALNRESYMVLRCGVEAQQGEAYPEELMVYPQSDRRSLPSASSPLKPSLTAVLTALLGATALLY
jgi:hypothetical protein